MIVDAHLDLAYNALRGRPVHLQAADQPSDHEGIATVGLPDLHAGGVGLICATIFVEPHSDAAPAGYRDAAEAHAVGRSQVQWYQQQIALGRMRMVQTPGELPSKTPAAGSTLPFILLLEGADPIQTPAEAAHWFNLGVRIVGLSWRQTRHAGGTGAPGPLTPEGRRLVAALDTLGMIHDASHLAEESFWNLVEVSNGPLIASHSNCREIVPTDRHLTPKMIRAIASRGGVIGVNFYDRFLISPDQPSRRATLADVVRQIECLCETIGRSDQVGLGTDLDGGFGRDNIPVEIQTAADLPRLADALRTAGHGDEAIRGFMGENWLRYFRAHLPAT